MKEYPDHFLEEGRTATATSCWPTRGSATGWSSTWAVPRASSPSRSKLGQLRRRRHRGGAGRADRAGLRGSRPRPAGVGSRRAGGGGRRRSSRLAGRRPPPRRARAPDGPGALSGASRAGRGPRGPRARRVDPQRHPPRRRHHAADGRSDMTDTGLLDDTHVRFYNEGRVRTTLAEAGWAEATSTTCAADQRPAVPRRRPGAAAGCAPAPVAVAHPHGRRPARRDLPVRPALTARPGRRASRGPRSGT